MAISHCAASSAAGTFRNFLRKPSLTQRFSFDDQTCGRLRKLAYAMTQVAGTKEENSSIPSGFTYLLQFAVHDLVDSKPSVLDGGKLEAVRNARTRRLQLETLYGVDNTKRRDPDDRSKFDIGHLYDAAGQATGATPGRDVSRTIRNGHWTANLSDPRNDSNVTLSQLTLLFLQLHNALADIQKSTEQNEDKRFENARRGTTTIYRHILRHEVLEKILHPTVYDLYKGTFKRVDQSRELIPFEFSHAAFRFGHAMVRPRYLMNRSSDDLVMITRLLREVPDRPDRPGPEGAPLTAEWIVSWSRFFDLRDQFPGLPLPAPNFARRIGPKVANSLTAESLFPQGKVTIPGLIHRDLMSAAMTELWSVPRLIEELRSEREEMTGILPDPRKVQYQVSNWLKNQQQAAFGISPADVKALADDPPMSFYILLEAELAREESPGIETLGPLGSIIIAEVMLAVLDVPGEFKGGRELGDKLTQISATFDTCKNLDRMVNLIGFVKGQLEKNHTIAVQEKPSFI